MIDAFEELICLTLKPFDRQLCRDMREGKRALDLGTRGASLTWMNYLACAADDQLEECLGVIMLFDEMMSFFAEELA